MQRPRGEGYPTSSHYESEGACALARSCCLCPPPKEGPTLPFSDDYYINVHLPFRGPWAAGIASRYKTGLATHR